MFRVWCFGFGVAALCPLLLEGSVLPGSRASAEVERSMYLTHQLTIRYDNGAAGAQSVQP